MSLSPWESRGALGGWRSNDGKFAIVKQGSLPSMVRWVLYSGAERVRSFRTLTEAKAHAETMAEEFAAQAER